MSGWCENKFVECESCLLLMLIVIHSAVLAIQYQQI